MSETLAGRLATQREAAVALRDTAITLIAATDATLALVAPSTNGAEAPKPKARGGRKKGSRNKPKRWFTGLTKEERSREMKRRVRLGQRREREEEERIAAITAFNAPSAPVLPVAD